MNSEHVEVLRELSEVCRAAIKAGDWKVDGACDPDSLLRHADAAIAALSAQQPPAEVQGCTCPSGDGSLRWPCPVHPPEAQPVAWMDPDTEDVIHDMRKTSWSTDYGVGGEKKARTYTTPLYAHPPPSAATPLSREHGSVQEMFNPSAPVGVPAGVPVGVVREYLDARACYDPALRHPNSPEGLRLREARNALDAAIALAQQPAAVDGAAVDRVAAALLEEATDEPWTVSGVEHEGPDRDYYRKLARKVLTLAAQQGGES